MRYISTRGQAAPQSFSEALLAGLASDGGLFMPESWPQISKAEIASFKGARFEQPAKLILSRFAAGSFTEKEIAEDVDAAYATFHGPVAPLVEIAPQTYLMELFHGPTFAFKDVAMQILGRLFARALKQRGGKATVMAATSGDTGSAAIAALGGLPNITVFVLHPRGRVSDVQRKQMTTSPHANVHNIALEGTFDDAQAIVKELFADEDFAKSANLTAVNSINFARIAAQSVYYFTAAADLGVAPVFVVPTGNFGDVFAGEAASRMGLPISKLVVATNSNDIMARALNDGVYASGSAQPTLSPSMDIQVASNFERALFEASGRDSAWLRSAMAEFSAKKSLKLPEKVLADLRARYEATAVDDAATLATIKSVHARTGRIIDPHTAVAVAGAERRGASVPTVVLSTAHAAKFPDAVRKAIGAEPPVPEALKMALNGPERAETLSNNRSLVRDFISSRLAG